MYRSSKSRLIGAALQFGLALFAARAGLAADNYYVPAGGGYWSVPGNWSLGHCPLTNEHVKILVSGAADKDVEYDWGGVSTFSGITVDGSAAGHYGAIWHANHVITTYDMYLGDNGPAWHWMEGPAYLWVNEILYVGYDDPGSGHFYLDTVVDYSAGLHVDDMCYVGYGGPGDFDQHSGIAQIFRLYIGQNAPGNYYLRDGRLEVNNQFVIGNGAEGTFRHTGGTVNQSSTSGIIMGLNTGGAGTYLMQAGELAVDHISLAWNGDAYFTQSGGTVTTVGDINIGCQGTHPMQTWYKLNEDVGPAVLHVGDDMLVGVQTLGKYEQTAGACTVGGNLEIWRGSTTSTSHVYLGTAAGRLDVTGEVINHSGYYDQDGGVMSTSHFTNDSTQGVNIDNSADFRATTLTHNAGTFWMWRNAILRGEEAMPGTYWLCNFANNATFQMGSAASPGGSFRGILTNSGTFNYYQGDFATSSLVNNGIVNLNGDFTCRRLVNNSTITVLADHQITADGAGYTNAIENNHDFCMSPRSRVDVGASKFVNNAPMYAGAPGADVVEIYGDLDNNGFLLPSLATLPAGHLRLHGGFTARSAAELRARIRGTGADNFDHVTVDGSATLAGTLDVRLTDGFVPAIGNSFCLLTYLMHRGQFDVVRLPTLPSGREWRLEYGSLGVTLSVVPTPHVRIGDLNCDGDVDFDDINPFVQILSNQAAWEMAHPGCPWQNGDCNEDGVVDFDDINPFVMLFGHGG